MLNKKGVVPMNVNLTSGKVITVSDSAFGREYNESLVHQVVVACMARYRQGTKAQKSRSEVRGGGRKPWKQKGSGRARAGSIRSPIWRGGGVSFAASNRDYEQKVNKKMYRGAMRSILSELFRQNRVVLVEDLLINEPKTKALVQYLEGLGLRNALLVTDNLSENLFLASRNLKDIEVCDPNAVDPVMLIRHETILLTLGALKQFEEVLS